MGGEATDEEAGDADNYIEEALIEAHHLANLTGVEEAKLARRRLVDAQSASRRTKTRDLLQEAIEYLELARMERRDAAKGFERARMHAIRAETAMADERHVRNWSIDRLFEPGRWASDNRTLADLRDEAAVDSYEQLRYEMLVERLLEELDVESDGVRVEDDLKEASGVRESGGELTVEEALALAEQEVDDGHADREEGGFRFLEADHLAPAEE